jgi:hypothetical protein
MSPHTCHLSLRSAQARGISSRDEARCWGTRVLVPRNDTFSRRRGSSSRNREGRSGNYVEVGKDGKLGKLGKDARGLLTNREAAGVEGIGANADLVAVEPAVPVAIRDARVRCERGFIRVQ